MKILLKKRKKKRKSMGTNQIHDIITLYT